jgi:hypothetical protein
MDSWIASHDKGRLFKSHEPTALEDVKELHVVFGGNSSVLIETVTAGVPAAYVDQLDHGSPDLHGLVAAGLIYRTGVDPDFDELVGFYRQPGWENRLHRFANVNEDEATVIASTVKAIRALCSIR